MKPVLYSFRRCPYAMRARLAVASAGLEVELREVVLRDKPAAFLNASPSGTVPCLVAADCVIDESLDVMVWALKQNDPEDWLKMPEEGFDWIARTDGPFKQALDRTKYPNRYPGVDPKAQRDIAAMFLSDLDKTIGQWIFDNPTLADFAIMPFVRQFAFIDKDWFDHQPWPRLQVWLERFLLSDRFAHTMLKYPQWREGDPPVSFP
jgi:glutathione S-transferase